MCSVNGVFTLEGELTKEEWERFVMISENATRRGRDSFGFVAFDAKGVSQYAGRIASKNVKAVAGPFKSGVKFAMSNNRAEPTTEFVKEKLGKDIQPYTDSSKRFYVVHNGTIANDKELIEKHSITDMKTTIDSAVVPFVLAKRFEGVTSISSEEMAKVIKEEFLGSYSFVIYDTLNPNSVFLACNYKPLFVERKGKTLFFTSMRDFFGDTYSMDAMHRNICEVPPYSVVKVDQNKLKVATLMPELNKKALVVCSGGLDSTVCAQVMKNRGFEVTLLHFKYKCRAEEKEVAAIQEIAKVMGVEYMFVETDLFKNVIKHSPLLDEGNPEVAQGDKGVEFAHEWVAARNLIMLSMATGVAEAHGYGTIVLGNNLEESGAYPDNEEIFIKKFATILPHAVNANKRVEIQMPVGNLMKHEIVKVGLQENAPLDKTWSCYENTEKHCGTCGPCRMRKVAFQMLEKPDPLEYLA